MSVMKIRQIVALMRNFGRVRNSLSFLASVYGGDGVQDAMGGLTSEERACLAKWIGEASRGETGFHVVEIGTLFGFTAKWLAAQTSDRVRITAVDNFCWNPFGMPAELHEKFTRDVLARELAEGSVRLVNADACEFLKTLKDAAFVFLDGDHRYEAVKTELELARMAGVRWLSGHDFGNPLFGVTRAVREVLGEPDEVVGLCWYKKI